MKKNFFKNIFRRVPKKKQGDLFPIVRYRNDVSINNLPTVSKGSTITSSSIKKLKPGVLSYSSSRNLYNNDGEFLSPEYDLAEIGVIEDVESIVRQANRKKAALMYKEGYDLVGKNQNTVQYIKERLHQISIATRIPNTELLRSAGISLIRLSNAIWLKVRNTESSGGSVRTTPEGKTLKPVAGYFPLPAETMKMMVDRNTGIIKKWRQEMPDGRYKDYNPEDIIHFYIGRKDGFIFGTPDLVPVIDDIRALRKIEENIELLVYQHLFPLFHYKVGTENSPAGYTEEGEKEIDVVKREIQYMPSEGGIVTPERHEITMVGAEGRAIRAEGYIQHFKMRVVAGLGISEMDLGIGNTANRGTARSLSRQLIDSVKAIQDVLEAQFNQEVVNELLLESTFAGSTDILAQQNLVSLQFREIDLENKIEYEKHLVELFQSNGITYSEFRIELGKEPIQVPDDLRKSSPSEFPDWHQTYWKLFSEPEQIIRSIDEGWIKTGLGEKQNVPKLSEVKNSAQLKDARIILQNPYSNLEMSILGLVSQSTDFSILKEEISSAIYEWTNRTISSFSSIVSTELIQGFDDETFNSSINNPSLILRGREEASNRSRYFLQRLSNDIDNSISNLFNGLVDKVLLMNSIRSIFSLMKYRVEYISDTEIRKAYYYGTILGMKSNGISNVVFTTVGKSCDKCNALNGREFSIDEINLDRVVPIHPNCDCIMIKK